MASSAPTLISRLAGIDAILQRLDDQDRQYQEFRTYTSGVLNGILEQQKIANGRTGKLETAIGLADDRADQIIKRRNERLPLRQGLIIAFCSVSGTGVVLAVLHWALGI